MKSYLKWGFGIIFIVLFLLLIFKVIHDVAEEKPKEIRVVVLEGLPFNYTNETCPNFVPKEVTCFRGLMEDKTFLFYIGIDEWGNFDVVQYPMQSFTGEEVIGEKSFFQKWEDGELTEEEKSYFIASIMEELAWT